MPEMETPIFKPPQYYSQPNEVMLAEINRKLDDMRNRIEVIEMILKRKAKILDAMGDDEK